MTNLQVREVERIKTRYGIVKTKDNGHVTLVYVHGDGGSPIPSLVIALDQNGQIVASRRVRRVKISDLEIEEAMA